MASAKLTLTSLILFSILAFSYNTDKIKGNLSPVFTISPDEKNMAVAVSGEVYSNLYLYSFADGKLSQLTSEEAYYSRPVYSPKGDRLLFLSKGLQAETSELWSIDLASKAKTKLTDGNIYVTEAVFVQEGERIMYCGSGKITNYSPMARRAPHDIDLYLINSDGSEQKKLTNLHAYELSSISPNYKGDSVLCHLVAGEAQGAYLLSVSNNEKVKVEAVNNPRPEVGESFYGSPVYDKDNKQISFIAPYQIYVMGMADRKCEVVWSNFDMKEQAMPIFSTYDASSKRLFFSVIPIIGRQYGSSAKINVIDLSTKAVSEVPIPLAQ